MRSLADLGRNRLYRLVIPAEYTVMNRLMDPHELGWHSLACRRGCVHGIRISWRRPFLLNTEAKVRAANKIREKIGRGPAGITKPWKFGDHCWYAPTKLTPHLVGRRKAAGGAKLSPKNLRG